MLQDGKELGTIDTQLPTHNLTLEGDPKNHSKYPKIMIVFHSLSHPSHIIKITLRL